MSSERLTREQWLDHGLQSLAQNGFTSLKADTLAKSLGVSRGSFYWHFKNLADFHTAVLTHWQTSTDMSTIALLESAPTSAEDKLRQLGEVAVSTDPSLEQAVRAWAYNSPDVQTLINTIDEQRITYIQHLLGEMGVDPSVCPSRAQVIYASYLGQIMLNQPLDPKQKDLMMDQLMALASL